jgi:hypothetical protein
MELISVVHQRNMIRCIISIVFCSIIWSFEAQIDSCLVIINIVDDAYSEPIPNANAIIVNDDQLNFYSSNPNGIIRLDAQVGQKLKIEISHPIFEKYQGNVLIRPKLKVDTLELSISLHPLRKIDLSEVVVKAPGIPDTVYGSSKLSVADFEILSDGRMVLLAYPKQLKKGSELLLYDGLKVQSSFSVPGEAVELVRDFRGNTHIVCNDNVYGLQVKDQDVETLKIDRAYYMKYIAPIVDTNHTKWYLSNFNKDYPAFNYYAFDQLDSSYSQILHIEDALMMELYRSEYKWVDIRTKLWAKEKEHETGIDAEIWVGANFFTQSIYYKELYAPMFKKNDSLYVFDYYKDKLRTFDLHGTSLDSVSIYHHYQPKNSGWRKQLIQDRGTGQIYALYEKSGFHQLGLVDTKTGQITEKVRLNFKYVDKIAVHDNFVYYIYRPYETAQKKFLYRERLPYDFIKSSVPQGAETLIDTGK